MNTTITIQLNQEEKQLFEEYSKVYKGGLSTMIKELAMEKLQDEYDLIAITKFENGIKDGSITTRPYEELISEVGLD